MYKDIVRQHKVSAICRHNVSVNMSETCIKKAKTFRVRVNFYLKQVPEYSIATVLIKVKVYKSCTFDFNRLVVCLQNNIRTN